MNTEPRQISLDHLHESQFNHRVRFDTTALQGLADDIKTQGILQPLLVRPRVPELFAQADDPDAICGFELVFGHRRLRAAQLAGLPTAPCLVRVMTDSEVKRAQVSENLQREDAHPLEEAEAFQALITDHGETADTLAASTGKSRSYVYGRLKLLGLCPQVREACLKGEVSADVALLIARLRTTKLQEKALTAIEGKYLLMDDGGKKSFRHIRDLLNERFTLDLKRAPFPVADDTLVHSAGPCTTCPKRSCNAPEYADLLEAKVQAYHPSKNYGANICTDPDCFDVKKVTFFRREADALRAKGAVVVDGNKARQAVGADGKVKGDYIAVQDLKALGVDLKHLATPRTKDDAPGPVTITLQDPRTGKTVTAMRKADLREAGVDLTGKTASLLAPTHAEQQAERKARADAENKRRLDLFHQIRSAARQRDRSVDELRVVVLDMMEMVDYQNIHTVLAPLWLADAAEKSNTWPMGAAQEGNPWPALVNSLGGADLALLLFDCMMVSDLSQGDWVHDDGGDMLHKLAALYGLTAPAEQAAVAQPDGGEGDEA